MWKSTEIIAYAIAQAFENKGIKAKLQNLTINSYLGYYDRGYGCQIYLRRLSYYQ